MTKINMTFWEFRQLIHEKLDAQVDSLQASNFAEQLELEFKVDPIVAPFMQLADDAGDNIPEIDQHISNYGNQIPPDLRKAYGEYEAALQKFQNIVDRYYGEHDGPSGEVKE